MKKHLATLLFVSLMMSLLAICALAQGVQSVELHGFMQNRFYANPDSSARFVAERVSLSAVGKFGTDAIGYVEVYYHPWLTDRVIGVPQPTPPVIGYTAEQSRIYLESVYADLPAGEGRLRIGKGRQLNFGLTPTYPNRKTSQYGIISETFTQDRIVGAQYTQKIGSFDFGGSLYTDQRVQNRKIGDFAGASVNQLMPSTKVVAHIVDKDDPANNPGTLAGSVRFGITKPDYQVHLSGASGKMVEEDVAVLNTAFGMQSQSTSRKHQKYGFDAAVAHGPFCLQTEYYQGKFSFLTITGYQVLLGYQPKDKIRGYVRWSALSNGSMNNRTASQLTWPTRQFTVGIIKPLRPGMWVELDYEKNMETTAGLPKPKNDLLFLELFTGF